MNFKSAFNFEKRKLDCLLSPQVKASFIYSKLMKMEKMKIVCHGGPAYSVKSGHKKTMIPPRARIKLFFFSFVSVSFSFFLKRRKIEDLPVKLKGNKKTNQVG